MSSTRRISSKRKSGLGNKSYMDIFIREYFENRDPRSISDEEWSRGSLHWELCRALARNPENSRERVVRDELERGIADVLNKDPRNRLFPQDMPLVEQLKRALWREPSPPLQKFKELQDNLESDLKGVLEAYKKQMPITYYTPIISTDSPIPFSGTISQAQVRPGGSQLPAIEANTCTPQTIQLSFYSPETVCYDCYPAETICMQADANGDSTSPKPTNGTTTSANDGVQQSKSNNVLDAFLRNYLLQGREPRTVTEEERYRGILHWELVRALQFPARTEEEIAIKHEFENDVRKSISRDPRNKSVSNDVCILEELKTTLWREPSLQLYHNLQVTLEQDLQRALDTFKQRLGIDQNSNSGVFLSSGYPYPTQDGPMANVRYEYASAPISRQFQEEQASPADVQQVAFIQHPTEPMRFVQAANRPEENIKGINYIQLRRTANGETVVANDLETPEASRYAIVPTSQILRMAGNRASGLTTSRQSCACPRKCDPRMCPYCGIGVFVKNTSNTGYVSAALCFPFALYCCLTKKCCTIVECSYCRATTDKSLEEIYPSSESDASLDSDIRNRRWRINSNSKKTKPGRTWWTAHKGTFRNYRKSKPRSASRNHRSRRRNKSVGRGDKTGEHARHRGWNSAERERCGAQKSTYPKRMQSQGPRAQSSVRVFYDGKDPPLREAQPDKY